MKALLHSFVLAFGFQVSFTAGLCSICPDGIDEGLLDADSNGEGSDKCSEIEIIYQGLDPFACLAQKPALMPNCCPSQLSTYVMDNVCQWCPNGVPDVYKAIPDIIQPLTTTCLNYMELVSFTEDRDGCSFFDQASKTCCPEDAGSVFKCEFCSQGLDFPALDPENDGTNCTVLQSLVNLVPDEGNCRFFKELELSCCPSSTELKPCDFCSKGLEFPSNTPFPDGSTCTELQNNATAITEGGVCDLLKVGESMCCPSAITDSYVCDFCSDGLTYPNQDVGRGTSDFEVFGEDILSIFVNFEEQSFACSDMVLFAVLAPNATACDLVQSFEGICCPSGPVPIPLPPIWTPSPTVKPLETPSPTPKPLQILVEGVDSGGENGAASNSAAISGVRSTTIVLTFCAFQVMVSL